ncbi:MAG: thioredoxin [Bdellovibrionaceae bacterium]|nr:thioredoxin [Pseudobdellovibrionaceae bacterium]
MALNITNSTDANFETDVLKSSVPVLVDFCAEWCGPCKALAPKLEELAGEFKEKMKVVKIDIDNNQESPANYGVRGVPTLLLFKDGQVVDQLVGNHPKDNISGMLAKHL